MMIRLQENKQDERCHLLTRISHEALQHGEKQTDPSPRYPPFLEYRRISSISEAAAARVPAFVPVLVADALYPVPPTFATLHNLVDAFRGQTLQVAVSRNRRVLWPIWDKNIPTSRYNLRETEALFCTMEAQEVLQSALAFSDHSITLKANITLPPGTVAHLGGTPKATLHAATAVDTLMHPLHYAQHPRMLLQLAGRTRVLVVEPHHAFAGLYPFAVHHAYDGYSMVDFEQPDWKKRWPLADTVRGRVATLRPGYALRLPAYAFCCVQSLDKYVAYADVPLEQSLPLIPWSFHLQEGPLAPSDVALGASPWSVPPLSAAGGAAALAVSRAVEAIMADALDDVDAVRKWLLRAGDMGW